jgi:cation transporter-like permease
LREVNEDDVAKFVSRVRSDPDHGTIPLNANPLMLFGVAKFGW